jgi:hypothetical protein
MAILNEFTGDYDFLSSRYPVPLRLGDFMYSNLYDALYAIFARPDQLELIAQGSTEFIKDSIRIDTEDPELFIDKYVDVVIQKYKDRNIMNMMLNFVSDDIELDYSKDGAPLPALLSRITSIIYKYGTSYDLIMQLLSYEL